ncbi:MAG TPA: SAM-dependent methyltransferase [Thermoanaerobaculia bacterium]|nr:SAM-dependent methyltransferase [Thermoanaerobaculia bacterium]
MNGKLTVIGTGIAGPAHLSAQSRAALEAAERVFFLVADPLSREWLLELRPDAEDLSDCYRTGRERADSYAEMVERLLDAVRSGSRICAAFYGHPGVFAFPSHEAVRRARAEGCEARMLPAISAEDCLFADLGVDPGAAGCQSFEATDFLVRRRRFDPTAGLVLWQVGVIAVADHRDAELWNPDGLRVLTEVLLESYPPGHPVVVYEATTLPITDPKRFETALAALPEAPVTALSTLWVRPLPSPEPDPGMLRRLGLAG